MGRVPHTEPWNIDGTQDKFILFLTVLLLTKRAHHFADKGLYSQSYSFFSSHVQMWELDHKEGWTLKNWCFWIAVLEKTLENPLDTARRSNQSILKEINPEYSLEGLLLKLKFPPDAKSWLTGKDPDSGKDWRQKEKWVAEDEMVRWHHWLNGHESEQTPGERGLQRSLVTRVHGVSKSQTWFSHWTTTIREGKKALLRLSLVSVILKIRIWVVIAKSFWNWKKVIWLFHFLLELPWRLPHGYTQAPLSGLTNSLHSPSSLIECSNMYTHPYTHSTSKSGWSMGGHFLSGEERKEQTYRIVEVLSRFS